VTSGIRAVSTSAALVALVAATGCGGGSSAKVPASQVRDYVAAVEKVRLPVNTLLDGADPILDAYRDKRITPAQASRRFGVMEQKFAAYTVAMQQINPSNGRLKALNTPYASTYFYEDSYLSTLASDLSEGHFDNLPNTQAAQRLAIVIWRTRLQVVADQSAVTLPADIAQASRGEIAPSVDGS
jgi:hypothetical protein